MYTFHEVPYQSTLLKHNFLAVMDEHAVLWMLHLNTLEVVVSLILYNWVVGDAVDCGSGVVDVDAQWTRTLIDTSTTNIQVALAWKNPTIVSRLHEFAIMQEVVIFAACRPNSINTINKLVACYCLKSVFIRIKDRQCVGFACFTLKDKTLMSRHSLYLCKSNRIIFLIVLSGKLSNPQRLRSRDCKHC